MLEALTLGAIALLLVVMDFDVSGNWRGLFLLRGKGPTPLVLKDDLFLGDGSRLIAGVSFSRWLRLLAGRGASGRANLHLEWSRAEGNGVIHNDLGDGTEIVTLFSRFRDDEDRTPHGLFVGGALPEAAASRRPEESGMSFRDGGGWHHVWCTTNELLLDVGTRQLVYPSQWQFLGSRVLISDAERVVLESSHLVNLADGTMRMDRWAYFRAGRPFFRLGVRLANAGETPVSFAYGYGDEPWVGHYGSAGGNVGWVRDELVLEEGPVDERGALWAGVVDQSSGIAAFLAWSRESAPDRIYFANRAGSNFQRLGQPLDSNEVFVGTEWLRITLRPGESRAILLTVGMARGQPGGVPMLPAEALP